MKSNTMIRNSVYSLLAKAATMVLFFALDVVCARSLDADAYGEWAYFYATITIIYSIVWFGINVSGKIFIAKTKTSKQMEVFFSALMLRLFVSIVFTCIYVIVVTVLDRMQVLNIQKYEHLTSLLLIGSGVVFFNSFAEFFKEIFIGLTDFKALFVVSVCEYGGYFLFGVIGLFIRKDAIGILFAFLFSLMFTVCVGFWIIFKYYHLAEARIERQAVMLECKKIFQYAKYIALSGIGTILLTEIDTFMLGYFREGYDTALYAIAKQLTSKAVHVNLALSASMMPIFAMITETNVQEKKKQFRKVMLYNFIATFGIAMCFLLFGGFVIQQLYGEQYRSAAKVLYVLLPYYVISSFSKFLVLFLDYQNKARIRSFAFLSTILADIILNVLFIPPLGAVGASIATDAALVPYFVFLIIETGIIFESYGKSDEKSDEKSENNSIGEFYRK